ncbi:membrane protein [Shewanella gelidii]|uniref:Murein endopeptidase K n=2 Tax=Shewanella gelidii TaxID=1642821 RepID=A0A917NB44_9GAMM|nr:membrane protein [Shewanella gelidii]
MCSIIPSKAMASRSTTGARTLSFYNRHTGERGAGTYWLDGNYQSEALNDFSHLLRDHRQNQAAPMDKRLFDMLHALQDHMSIQEEIHVISGYRSPKTNQMLSNASSGVAKKSYHMRGMAMDIAIPSIKLSSLRDAALSLKLGGVGYYPKSGFIHVDCGPVRSW